MRQDQAAQELAGGQLVDDRLARLLEVEKRLELRVQEAERDAKARVDAVRAAAQQTGCNCERDRAELERAAREEERADVERHTAELAMIERQSAEELRRLSLDGDAVERLAKRIYARVLRGGAP